MGWVKLDDAFGEHPKIARISDTALALWVTGLAYCNRNLTDGFIPNTVGLGQLRYCEGNAIPGIRELESVGLWIPVKGGWQVHDYADFQPSREAVLAEREAARGRMQRRRSGEQPGDVRANDPEMFERTSPTPVPVPVPVPQEQERKTPGEASFAAFYERFPRHMKPRDAETAYNAALRRASHAEIMAGVDRLVADPNLPPKDLIPYPATWLRADSWKNDPYEPESNGKGPPRDRAAEILRGAAAKGGSRGSLPG